MTEVGRNQPCPCGSGKKYKACHLRIEEASPAAKARTLATLERRYLPALQAFASTWRPECIEEASALFWLHRETPVIPLQLLAPYGLYHRMGAKEPSAAEEFLNENGKKLMDNERALLRAQLAAWLSIWEIVDVEHGVGLEVRDRLTGVERFCHERKGSEALVRRDVVLGRVVDCDGVSCFFGMYGRPMSPSAADDVEQVARRKLRKKGRVPPEALRHPKIERLLIEQWQLAFAALDARPPPKLVNTDGEDLLLTVDHSAFNASDRQAVVERIAAIPGMEREDDSDEAVCRFALFRPGNAIHKSWDNTVLGHLAVDETGLRVETNSIARADALRQTLEAALGKLVRFGVREHTDPMALVDRQKAPAPPREHSAEEQTALREFLAKHYAAWVDTELRALDGKTPREATATAAGRRAVDRLLREMENHDARRPEDERYDFTQLRQSLGIDESARRAT